MEKAASQTYFQDWLHFGPEHFVRLPSTRKRVHNNKHHRSWLAHYLHIHSNLLFHRSPFSLLWRNLDDIYMTVIGKHVGPVCGFFFTRRREVLVIATSTRFSKDAGYPPSVGPRIWMYCEALTASVARNLGKHSPFIRQYSSSAQISPSSGWQVTS